MQLFPVSLRAIVAGKSAGARSPADVKEAAHYRRNVMKPFSAEV
jgi:hypothetical protein